MIENNTKYAAYINRKFLPVVQYANFSLDNGFSIIKYFCGTVLLRKLQNIIFEESFVKLLIPPRLPTDSIMGEFYPLVIKV